MTNSSNLSQFFVKLPQQMLEKQQQQEAKKIINEAIDKLHEALKLLPAQDPKTGFLSETRREVLLALHHSSWSVNLIDAGEEEEDNRGSGR